MKKISAILFLLFITAGAARAKAPTFAPGDFDSGVKFNMPANYAAGEDDKYSRLVKAISQTAEKSGFHILAVYVKNTDAQPDHDRYIIIGAPAALEKASVSQKDFDDLKRTVLQNQGQLSSDGDMENVFKDVSEQLDAGLSVDSIKSLGGFDIREDSFSTLDVATRTAAHQGLSSAVKQAQANTYIFRGDRVCMLIQHAPVASAEEVESFKAEAIQTLNDMNFQAGESTFPDRYKRFGIPVLFIVVYLLLRNMNKKRRSQMQDPKDRIQ